METVIITLGIAAVALSSLSYVPQLRKVLPRGSTADRSSRTLVALAGGLTLWAIYGVARSDWILALANLVGLILVAGVLACVVRDRFRGFAPVRND
jgi:MtN3 and saliva related transmembrane protein